MNNLENNNEDDDLYMKMRGKCSVCDYCDEKKFGIQKICDECLKNNTCRFCKNYNVDNRKNSTFDKYKEHLFTFCNICALSNDPVIAGEIYNMIVNNIEIFYLIRTDDIGGNIVAFCNRIKNENRRLMDDYYQD